MQYPEEEQTPDFSLKSFFVPFTTVKAITWIVIVGFIVYFNSLFNGFVWDDKTYVLANVMIYGIDITKLFSVTLMTNQLSHFLQMVNLLR